MEQSVVVNADQPNQSAYEEVTSLTFDGKYDYVGESEVEISNQEQDLNGFSSIEGMTDKEKIFPCCYCDKRFSRKPHLTSHMRQHTGEKPYACHLCEKRYCNSSSLTLHIRTHTGQKPYACLICSKRFPRLSGLKNHVMIHAGGKTYSCKICGVTFGGSYWLEEHMAKKHPNVGIESKDTITINQAVNSIIGENKSTQELIPADDMEQGIQTETVLPKLQERSPDSNAIEDNILLQRALEEATLGPIFDISQKIAQKFQQGGYSLQVCETCGKSVRNIKTHRKSHTKRYPCEVCGKLFKSNFSLKCHSDKHSETGVKDGHKRHKCTTCNHSFYQRGQLTKHIRTHTGEKPFSCKFCDYKAAVEKSLEIHTRIHTGERPFKCNTCGKTFAYGNVLKDHTRTHTGERPYSCKICNKRFTRTSSLRAHKVVHTVGKAIACSTCGHKSRTKGDARKHALTHMERPRPHECTKCEKAFHFRYTLRRHLQEVHDKHRILCPVCNGRFVNEAALAAHVKRFEGKKPFKCGHCGRQFHAISLARKHILTHSEKKEISFFCRTCDMKFINVKFRDEHEAVFADSPEFKCSVCGKGFHIETCARNHVGLHTEKEIEDAGSLDITIVPSSQNEYLDVEPVSVKNEEIESQEGTCTVVVERRDDTTDF